jgi:hypothetical protein
MYVTFLCIYYCINMYYNEKFQKEGSRKNPVPMAERRRNRDDRPTSRHRTTAELLVPDRNRRRNSECRQLRRRNVPDQFRRRIARRPSPRGRRPSTVPVPEQFRRRRISEGPSRAVRRRKTTDRWVVGATAGGRRPRSTLRGSRRRYTRPRRFRRSPLRTKPVPVPRSNGGRKNYVRIFFFNFFRTLKFHVFLYNFYSK